MALNDVKEYLKKYNADDRVVVLDESSATVSLAAHALHTTEERIAKTLSFRVSDKIVLIVLAGDAKINNSKFKHYFGEKAHMLQFDEVESLTGHPVGGVCPFAVKPGVEVYLDESLKRFTDEQKEPVKTNPIFLSFTSKFYISSFHSTFIYYTNLIFKLTYIFYIW